MIGVGVTRHHDVESLDREGGELRRDLIAFRTAVDEHRGPFRRREESCIALSDVEEANRGPSGGPVPSADAQTKKGIEAIAAAISGREGFQPVRTHTTIAATNTVPPTRTSGSAVGRQVADRRLPEVVGDELEPSHRQERDRTHEPSQGEPDQTGPCRDGAEQERGSHERERGEVRGQRHERDLVEVVQEDRRHAELRGDRRPRRRGDRSRREPAEPLGEWRGERDHPGGGGDAQLEAHGPNQPGVEDEQAEHGGREDRRGGARPAREHPDQREAGHHPRTEHRRLRTCQDREERHGAETHGELRPSREPQQRGRRQHRGEDHRDVPARDDEQMAEAGRAEVSLEPGVELRIVTEEQTEEQARLLREGTRLDRAADDPSDRLGRTDERAGGRVQARQRVWSWSCAGMPL